MEFIEVKIKTKSDAVELITGILMTNNIPNVRIIDDVEVDRFLLDHPLNWDYKPESPPAAEAKEGFGDAEVIFYVQKDVAGKEFLEQISDSIYALAGDIPDIDFGKLSIVHGPVNDDDWLHEWKKTYKPFTIGKSVVVCPFWEVYNASPEETVFTIDPGAVFGTGLHETTQLCVMTLEDLPLKGTTVLDIGCGSGILSVISLLLGASSAVACDIDPGAARCANENARLNSIDTSRFKVYTGDIFQETFLHGMQFDIVLANIVADVIVGLAPFVSKFLKKGGLFIASGIIDERIEEVRETLIANGFVLKNERNIDGWYCLCLSIL